MSRSLRSRIPETVAPSTRVCVSINLSICVPAAKKDSPARSLSEIAISLNCGQNSARKFQTGVSNSGEQIPKHARQNSEVPEISCFS